ncbi:MAG: hypothetical protein ACFFDT_38660 [Candidatus Hodarchaeota archaeon]
MADIKKLGIKGEKDVCRLLRILGFPVCRSDGHIIIKNNFCLIEAKNKSRAWNPPPYWGHGLDKDQFEHYMKIYKEYDIRTILLVPGKESGWIWNYLDNLAIGPTHLTPSSILVFPFESFRTLEELGQEIKLSSFMRGAN